MTELSTRRFALISGADSGYSAGDWLVQNMPKGVVSSNATYTFDYALYWRTGITELSLPKMSKLANSVCHNCINLTKLYLPSCTSIGVSSLNGIGAKVLVFPAVRELGNYSCRNCANLTAIDFAYDGTQAPAFRGSSAFADCPKLNTLILRSGKMWTIGNVNNFTNTPFASGKSGGTIYVPGALIDTYKAHATWSVILGYGGGTQNQILPIEGSIYETQYADGTPIEGD